LDRYKGLETFLRAIELVWQARPQTRVAMFGFGNLAQRAQVFVEKYARDPRLKLYSRVPPEQMVTLIQSSRVILGQQCPEYGSLSLSELESMACGKPVVCDFRYPEAYAEPPPVLVSHTAEEACAHILRFVEDADLRQIWGRRAREWVTQYHELGHVARALLAIYQRHV
jgi:glycosyltransferase involved in cell wall biosynthesis